MCEFWWKINKREKKKKQDQMHTNRSDTKCKRIKKEFMFRSSIILSINRNILFVLSALANQLCEWVCVKLVFGGTFKSPCTFQSLSIYTVSRAELSCVVCRRSRVSKPFPQGKKISLCKTTEKQSPYGNWNRHQPISDYQFTPEQENKY